MEPGHCMEIIFKKLFNIGAYRDAEFLSELSIAKDPSVCCICLEAIGDEAVLPCCGRAFHPGCISCWLGVKRTCPICRAPVRTLPQHL